MLDLSNLADSLRASVSFLASDDLEGRGVDGEGIKVAASYIATQFAKLGLATEHFDGTALQPVKIVLGARVGNAADNYADFEWFGPSVPAGKMSLKLSEGMSPLAIGSDQAKIKKSKLAFVGYGVTAPEYNYDDYQGIDVSDAVVVLLRKEPGRNDPDSPFDGLKNTKHAWFDTKIKNAEKHGAAAVILVNDSNTIDQIVAKDKQRIQQEQARQQQIRKQLQQLPKEAENSRASFMEKLENSKSMIESISEGFQSKKRGVISVGEAGERSMSKLPVLSIGRTDFDKLVQTHLGKSLLDVETLIDERHQPFSFSFTELEASIGVHVSPTQVTSHNVVGVLEGRGELADETVVIGAHYDHVGMGGYGSLAPETIEVHNGADDNASGTATLIHSAAMLSKVLAQKKSHRRIVFIAFTGEERGLLGSKYYVDHPLFDIKSTVAMLNLDMVGRVRDNELTIYGTGSADEFDDWIEDANETAKFELYKVLTGYGPSDHQSFYVAGVPVLFFFTGLHNDYHRPSDDTEKLDFGGMARIASMVTDVAERIAIETQRPSYVQTNKKQVRIRRQLTAYLGITMSEQADHVYVSSVAPGGPAEKAGLKISDRIDRMAKQRVRQISDVLEALRTRSPGQSMAFRVTRGLKTVDLQVQLGKRPAIASKTITKRKKNGSGKRSWVFNLYGYSSW